MTGDSKKIAVIIFLTSKMMLGFEDKFYKKKLFDAGAALIETYVSLASDAAQYNRAEYLRFKNSVQNFINILDMIAHAKSEISIPLSRIISRVLSLQFRLLKRQGPVTIQKIQRIPEVESKYDNQKNKKNFSLKFGKIGTRDKILEFIKKTDRIRTKDLIGQFSALSERTVKRVLRELVEEGSIKKEEDNRAVYYSSAI